MADGRPCQDRSLYIACREFALAAVADGAGSASLSQHGAAAVLELIAPYLRSTRTSWKDSRGVVVGLLSACRSELNRVASCLGCGVGDLTTTLSFVAASPRQVLAGRIGDGVIVGRRQDEMLVLAAAGEHEGEFHNETVFVTSSEAEKHMWSQVFPAKEFGGFALMSDGAAESLHRRSDGFVAPVVEKALRLLDDHSAEDVSGVIEERLMPELLSRTQDDCSLALMGNVPIGAGELLCSSRRIQRRVLGVGNDRGLRNRLAVLKTVQMSVGEAVEATGLCASTIRLHRRALNDILV